MIDLFLNYIYRDIVFNLLKGNEETNRPEAELMAEDIGDLDLFSSTDIS